MLRTIAENIISSRFRIGKGRILKFLLGRLHGHDVRSRYGPIMRVRVEDLTNYFCLTGFYSTDYDDVYAEVDRLSAGMAFIDVGANLGLFSMIASRRVGNSGVVLAFEPSLTIFSDLISNLVTNRLENVFAFNAALGDGTKIATFDTASEAHTGVAHLSADGSKSVLQLEFDALEGLFQELIQDRDTVIKIDVEGAEHMVALGMERFLRRPQVKKVIVEIDNGHLARFASDRDAVYRLLFQCGFSPRRADSQLPHYNEIFERPATDR